MGRDGIGPAFRAWILILLGIAGLVLGGYLIRDHVEQEASRKTASADWRRTYATLAAQLKQTPPLDLGAVWVTHSGRICGLVNGRWSGGYIPGMMPFHARGAKVWLVRKTTELDFADGWGECVRDDWFKLVEGSKESGYCAAREMKARCVEVGGVDRHDQGADTRPQ